MRSSIRPLALTLCGIAVGCGGDEDAATTVVERTVVVTQAPAPVPTTPQTQPQTTDDEQDDRPDRAERISRRRAIGIVRRRYPGERVVEVDRGEDDGRAVWEIELRTRGGAERE